MQKRLVFQKPSPTPLQWVGEESSKKGAWEITGGKTEEEHLGNLLGEAAL